MQKQHDYLLFNKAGYGDPNLDDNMVEVPLYKFVHNDQKKRYIKIIQLPEIALLLHSDGLYGVQIGFVE